MSKGTSLSFPPEQYHHHQPWASTSTFPFEYSPLFSTAPLTFSGPSFRRYFSMWNWVRVLLSACFGTSGISRPTQSIGSSPPGHIELSNEPERPFEDQQVNSTHQGLMEPSNEPEGCSKENSNGYLRGNTVTGTKVLSSDCSPYSIIDRSNRLESPRHERCS